MEGRSPLRKSPRVQTWGSNMGDGEKIIRASLPVGDSGRWVSMGRGSSAHQMVGNHEAKPSGNTGTSSDQILTKTSFSEEGRWDHEAISQR